MDPAAPFGAAVCFTPRFTPLASPPSDSTYCTHGFVDPSVVFRFVKRFGTPDPTHDGVCCRAIQDSPQAVENSPQLIV